MPMYNLLGYGRNYSKTFGSLWNYYRDELADETNDNNGSNNDAVNSESFKYKKNIRGSTYNVASGTQGYNVNKEGTKEVEIVVPLNYLGNFWETLDMPLINCEVSLALTWPVNCVITSPEKRLVTAAQRDNPEVRDDSSENATFKITGTKLHVPFEIPVKNKEETYEAIMEIMSRNNKYTTGNLLDYEYFLRCYTLIAIDLSKKIELENLDLKLDLKKIMQQCSLLLRKKRKLPSISQKIP